MIKIFLLAKLLNLFQIVSPEGIESLANTLEPGTSVWVSGKLSDSYENEIFSFVGLCIVCSISSFIIDDATPIDDMTSA